MTIVAIAQDCDYSGEIVQSKTCIIKKNGNATEVYIADYQWYYRFSGAAAEQITLVYSYVVGSSGWFRDYGNERVIWSGGVKPASGPCREHGKTTIQSWDISDKSRLCIY